MSNELERIAIALEGILAKMNPVVDAPKKPLPPKKLLPKIDMLELNELLVKEVERLGTDGQSKVMNVLKSYGVLSVKQLDPAKYNVVLQQVRELP